MASVIGEKRLREIAKKQVKILSDLFNGDLSNGTSMVEICMSVLREELSGVLDAADKLAISHQCGDPDCEFEALREELSKWK